MRMNPKDARNAGRQERTREEAIQASIRETGLPTGILEAAGGKIQVNYIKNDLNEPKGSFFYTGRIFTGHKNFGISYCKFLFFDMLSYWYIIYLHSFIFYFLLFQVR